MKELIWVDVGHGPQPFVRVLVNDRVDRLQAYVMETYPWEYEHPRMQAIRRAQRIDHVVHVVSWALFTFSLAVTGTISVHHWSGYILLWFWRIVFVLRAWDAAKIAWPDADTE